MKLEEVQRGLQAQLGSEEPARQQQTEELQFIGFLQENAWRYVWELQARAWGEACV